ncbi:MAG: HAD hydrolase-like protein [Anaerolineae bacterium]|nr:HAD hydrolase-like protein [Anaerolineae bacterium]
MYWLLDFDDTIASGPMTWALDHAIPRLIAEHRLRYTQSQLDSAVLRAQQRSNQEFDLLPIVRDFFTEMNWSPELQDRLINDVLNGYQPELFPEVSAFFERLRTAQHQIIIVSNNNRAPKLAKMLNIEQQVVGIYTPKMFSDCQPKPQRGLWDAVIIKHQDIADVGAVMIGDDPWSDGEFADNCGLECWIVDRLNRYQTLYKQKSYRWCSSLLDVAI